MSGRSCRCVTGARLLVPVRSADPGHSIKAVDCNAAIQRDIAIEHHQLRVPHRGLTERLSFHQEITSAVRI